LRLGSRSSPLPSRRYFAGDLEAERKLRAFRGDFARDLEARGGLLTSADAL
jgi:hypothetical protein